MRCRRIVVRQMEPDADGWLARWNRIAGRDGLTLSPDGDRWRLDPTPEPGRPTDAETVSVSDDVRRLPDGRVITSRMTREEVEAFFGPEDGAI